MSLEWTGEREGLSSNDVNVFASIHYESRPKHTIKCYRLGDAYDHRNENDKICAKRYSILVDYQKCILKGLKIKTCTAVAPDTNDRPNYYNNL